MDTTLNSNFGRLYGVHWAGDGTEAVASRVTGVRVDLDPNTNLPCDGFEVLPGQECDGAGDSGGFQECEGDRESFQCVADPSP